MNRKYLALLLTIASVPTAALAQGAAYGKNSVGYGVDGPWDLCGIRSAAIRQLSPQFNNYYTHPCFPEE